MRDWCGRLAGAARAIPPACRAACLALLPIKSAGDVARAMGALTAALAQGLIAPVEGQVIAKVVTTFVQYPIVQTIETSDFGRRLTMIEGDCPLPERMRALQPEEETRCRSSGAVV